MSAMRGLHVLGHGGVTTSHFLARMTGNAEPCVQDFDGGLPDARFDFLAHQRVRYAVLMTVDVDVVLDVDPTQFELRQLVRLRRQRHQCRPVDRL